MPLSQADTARLYSDAFATNMKTQLAENGFALCDLKTQLDVQKAANGVLQDELDAANKRISELTPAPPEPVVAEIPGDGVNG